MNSIFIKGNVPSKKNNKQITFIGKKCAVCRRGRKVTLLPPKLYRRWEKEAKKQLDKIIEKTDTQSIEKHVFVKLYFLRSSNRRFDYVNASQGILDLLVEYKFIKDDSAKYCTPIFTGYEVNKDNPGVKITIDDRELL